MSSGAMAGPASEASQPVDLNQHPSGLIPIIQNVVATVNLSCKVNTKDIAMKARNAECPPRLPAVILRIREPKTTALIFPTGKMVCTGAKSKELAKVASRKFAKIVQKVGYDVEFKDFKVQNLVATCSMPFLISLERLSCSAHSASGFTRYEPELFPGLIYHMKKPKVVLLIFISGKVVITGAKVKGDLDKAFQNIYPVLREYERVRIGI